MIEYSMDDLPLQTPEIPGIGGRVKTVPEDFIVEEIPIYEPSGEGEHLFVTLRRRNMTTRTLQQRLADLFQLDPSDIGYAGLKDRFAVVTQTFSLPFVHPELVTMIEEQIGEVEVLSARRHKNKLKLGHLSGNRFTITIRLPPEQIEDSLQTAQQVGSCISRSGMFNYFGPQRFGMHMDNHLHGRRLVHGERLSFRPNRWQSRLYVSAYQSYLFNYYLKLRHDYGWSHQLLMGDVARKTDTGGLFYVQDSDAEQTRFERGEICYTGPLYGYKMMTADEAAADLEFRLLDEEQITLDSFRRLRTTGDRRRGLVYPHDLQIGAVESGIRLSFTLPPGSFASILIREVTKLPFQHCG